MPSVYLTASGKRRYRARRYYRDADGRRREETKSFERDRDARQWEAEERIAAYMTPAVPTVASYVDSQWDVIMADLSVGTAQNYAALWRTRVGPTLGTLRLDEITPAVVRRAQVEWQSSPTARGRKSQATSASTVRQARNLLSRCLKFAVDDELIAANPVAATRPPRPDRAKGVLTLEPEALLDFVDRLDELARYPVHADLLVAQVFLGTRIGETIALLVRDVDLAPDAPQGGRLYVHQAARLASRKDRHGNVVRDQALVIDRLKSRHGRPRDRYVPIPDVPLLRERLIRNVIGKRRSDYLFTGPRDGQIYPPNLRRDIQWERLIAEFDLGKFTFHDLRATAIVWAIKAGVPISTVRDIAGHSSLAVTNVYARAARNDMQDANQAMTTYLNAYARRTRDEQEAS
jgi:integrase